jgi:hypothetical protein
MGKTSLLVHLLAHQGTYLPAQAAQPPLVLARLDLQQGIEYTTRFYSTALRELLIQIPPSQSTEARQLVRLRGRLQETPEATYDTFMDTLHQLRDQDGICVRPVVVIDEFECLLDPSAQPGFPYPTFFDGMRALLTADLLAMVVTSRRPLAEYFSDPARSNTMTSTFPTYFAPFVLETLDAAAADALLWQPSDCLFTLAEVAQARRRAGGHPCHLQVAGAAWYEANVEHRSARWAYKRFIQLKGQNCMVSPPPTPLRPAGGSRYWHVLRRVCWESPCRVGQFAQRMGKKLDDVAAWLIGAGVLIFALVLVAAIVLFLLHLATGEDIQTLFQAGIALLKKALQLGS